MYDNERIVKIIHMDKPIGCCGGHEFLLLATNGGYTTECKKCGVWVGQWFRDPEVAINYFEEMIRR